MDFRQLRTFVHVVELGSICAAAQRLNIVQSALTRQIQLLEQELETRLLERHGRGVTPTAKGDAFFLRAKQIIAQIDEAREETRAHALNCGGIVKIGMPPEIANMAAAGLMRQVAKEHPKVRLNIVSSYSGDIQEWLGQGVIDIGVLCDHIAMPLAKLKSIKREPMAVVGRAGLLPKAAEYMTLAMLKDIPLVLNSKRHATRHLIDSALAHVGGGNILAEMDCLSVQIEMVLRGDCVAVLPQSAISHAFNGENVRVMAIEGSEITRELMMAVPIDRNLDAATLQLKDIVFDQITSALNALNNVHHLPVKRAS